MGYYVVSMFNGNEGTIFFDNFINIVLAPCNKVDKEKSCAGLWCLLRFSNFRSVILKGVEKA